MRVVALITCLIALMAAVPATAQAPDLTLNGNGTFGTSIVADVTNAVPGAHGVMLVGFTRGPFTLGQLATAGIASPILDSLGTVPQTGILSRAYPVPGNLPPILTGQPLHFQAATVEPSVQLNGQMIIKLSTVQTIVLRDPASDAGGLDQ